jgi:hypothetical protein
MTGREKYRGKVSHAVRSESACLSGSWPRKPDRREYGLQRRLRDACGHWVLLLGSGQSEEGSQACFFSEEFRDQTEVGLSSDALRPSHTWSDYSVGVAAQTREGRVCAGRGEFADLRRGSDRRWAQFFGID